MSDTTHATDPKVAAANAQHRRWLDECREDQMTHKDGGNMPTNPDKHEAEIADLKNRVDALTLDATAAREQAREVLRGPHVRSRESHRAREGGTRGLEALPRLRTRADTPAHNRGAGRGIPASRRARSEGRG